MMVMIVMIVMIVMMVMMVMMVMKVMMISGYQTYGSITTLSFLFSSVLLILSLPVYFLINKDVVESVG